MQAVIIEQDYTFHNGELLHNWSVQLLGTTKVVARIKETARKSFERYELVTYGNKPGGNRYRTYATMDEATEVVLKWAKRRFRDEC